jgi:hypothetical protein
VKLLKVIAADESESYAIVRDPGHVPWTLFRLSPEGDETDEKVDWRVMSSLRLRDHPEPLLVVFGSVDIAKGWLSERAPEPAMIGWDALFAPGSGGTRPSCWEDARGEHDRFVAWAEREKLDPFSPEAWERGHAEGGPLRHSLRLFDAVNCVASSSVGCRVVEPGRRLELDPFKPRSCNWEGTAKLEDEEGQQLWTGHADQYCPNGGSSCCVLELGLPDTATIVAYTE